MVRAYVIAASPSAAQRSADYANRANGLMAEDVAAAAGSVADHRGSFVVRGERSQLLKGDAPSPGFTILVFPSYDVARERYNSEHLPRLNSIQSDNGESNVLLVEEIT